MIEGNPDEPLIEIGDPEVDEVAPAGAPAQVVIEYRDRGVPWMLMPPLLIAIAVVAVVGSSLIKERMRTPGAGDPVASVSPPVPPKPTFPDDLDKLSPHLPQEVDTPAQSSDDIKFVESLKRSAELPVEAKPAPGELAGLAIPNVRDPGSAEPAKGEIQAAQPPQGFGFDPSALKTDAILAGDGHESRPNLQPPPGDGRNVEEDAAPNGLPLEVDDDLLPPDPRVAQFDRKQRAVAARRRVEAERLEFHARLSDLCKKLGPRASPQIDRLCQEYQSNIDPSAKEQAVKLLGKTGKYAGASRSVRINLLRSLGFPESAILLDVFDNEGRWVNHMTRGVGSRGDVLYRSATILLGNPPSRAENAALSATRKP